jgi:hypothetical protein
MCNIERTDNAGEMERSALKRENATLFPEAPPYVVVPHRLLLRDRDYVRKAWKLGKYLCLVVSGNHNLLIIIPLLFSESLWQKLNARTACQSLLASLT